MQPHPRAGPWGLREVLFDQDAQKEVIREAYRGVSRVGRAGTVALIGESGSRPADADGHCGMLRHAEGSHALALTYLVLAAMRVDPSLVARVASNTERAHADGYFAGYNARYDKRVYGGPDTDCVEPQIHVLLEWMLAQDICGAST